MYNTPGRKQYSEQKSEFFCLNNLESFYDTIFFSDLELHCENI